MKKALPLKFAENRMYLDLDSVAATYVSEAEMMSNLADILDNSNASEESSTIQLYNLEKLLGTSKSKVSGEYQVILIDDPEMPFGLLVREIGEACDIDEDMLKPMPLALSSLCRSCLPFVVIEEESIVPVINPQGVPLLNL